MFTEMFPDIVSGEHEYECYSFGEESGYEPLSVEHLGGDTYGFMTFYIQEGDLMRDPDFTFTLDHENKTLTMLEYQQDGVPPVGTIYQSVYDENDNFDEQLEAALSKNFLELLRTAKSANRPLERYTDRNDITHKVSEEETGSEAEQPEEIIEDRNANLREVLNDFSKKHGLGELNVDPKGYSWELTEKLGDGSEIKLGDIMNPEYGMMFTPDLLRKALERFEQQTANRGSEVSELFGRKISVTAHGGTSALPKVQENLPDISYAANPSERISDNLAAIRELIRLENSERNGMPLYDNRKNHEYSKENSDLKLRKFCGWGGLPQLFDERFRTYEYQREQLKKLLTPDEYAQARASTLNAHYTSQFVIDAMYKMALRMGIPRDSRVLEPAAGTGNFITRMPHSIGNGGVTAVELDSITARICEKLNNANPDVKVINSGFEHVQLDSDSFDLVISNVPFGGGGEKFVDDNSYPEDGKRRNMSLHNGFIRKSIDLVEPGGVVMVITSSFTMDGKNPADREIFAKYCDLEGAIRLPNNAFSEVMGHGNGVTADILVFKKRENPREQGEKMPDWCYTAPDDNGLRINSYFVENPQMILGAMEKTTHFDMLTCVPHDGKDLEKELNEACSLIETKLTVKQRERRVNQQRESIEPWGKDFCFHVKDGKVYYRQGEEMEQIKGSKQELEKLVKLCELRDTIRKLVELQNTSVSDSELVPLRESLNKQYDEFTEKYGTLSSKSVKKSFGNDNDYPLLASLETFDKAAGKVAKADIFFRRTVSPMVEIKAAETAEESLQISVDRKGKPDLLYMATLLSDKYPEMDTAQRAAAIRDELLEKGDIYINPERRIPGEPFSGIEEASEYLSGNVRMKLVMAQEAAKTNPEFERNIPALQARIKPDIKLEEVFIQLGNPMIDTEDITAFLEHLSGRNGSNTRNCNVSYSPATGEYDVLNAGSKKNLNLTETTTCGTADLNMYQLAEKLLNHRRIVVKREYPHPKDPTQTITKTDSRATRLAHQKAAMIAEEFPKWIIANRREKYERIYNDIHNSFSERKFDGSGLSLPGTTFKLRPHQLNAVARAVYGGNTLVGHAVGAGKSAVMFASIMKKKQLGLINKACMVVPKPLTEQTAAEFRRLYPSAKILTVTNDDLSTEAKRKLFTARVATGSYDAVIMSQEQYEKIPMSKQYCIDFIQKELDQLEDMLRDRKAESRGKPDYSVKAIERRKKLLKQKLERLINPKSASKAKDNLFEFENLGFDYLVVDEAHAYKNGFVNTKMTNVAGVTTRPSGRAEDMQMKTDYFNQEFGQGHIIFSTGTPISNSMTELYVMQRYLCPDLLEAAGILHFDSWASTFGKVTTKNQLAADGTIKLRESFSSFENLPELRALCGEFADILTSDKLDLPRPELKTGKAQLVVVPATPEQRAFVRELANRAKAIQDGAVEPYEDNLLKITGEARYFSLGNQALQAIYDRKGEEPPFEIPQDKDGKVDACIEKVAEIYQQTNDTKGVQIIFSDIAVNSDNGNFSAYDYIKKELVENYGIPEDEIVFAPKADSKNREDIFRDINSGKYRVVIASTGTLGTGANIQQSLYALHHLDIPWKPSDFEQREGRILRQGNKFDEVEIFNYVTEGTMDSYLYQTVANKARFIAQFLNNENVGRSMEDCDEKVLAYGEFQAQAEGNPDFRRFIELANEINELTMLRSEYAHETVMTQQKLEQLPGKIESEKEKLAKLSADRKSAEQIKEIILTKSDGSKLSDRKEINAYLFSLIEQKQKAPDKEIPAVKIGDFEITLDKDSFINEMRFVVKGELEYMVEAGISEKQDNVQRIANFLEKTLPKRTEESEKQITFLEENIKQAEERIAAPFPREKELTEKSLEYSELEIRLTDVTAHEDDIYDPEDEPIVESAEEKAEREEIYSVDEDDLKPDTNDDDGNNQSPNKPTKPKM